MFDETKRRITFFSHNTLCPFGIAAEQKKEKKNVIPKINYGFRGLSNAHDHTNIGSCSQIKEDLDDGSISEMYDTDSHFVWDKFDERPILTREVA
ncbi:hypothetical protein Peur_057598 [Populus x canadensis]